jgi:hypothetical protein
VQYLHGFPGVKDYRTRLVHTETIDDVYGVTADIKRDHSALLKQVVSSGGDESLMAAWDQCSG